MTKLQEEGRVVNGEQVAAGLREQRSPAQHAQNENDIPKTVEKQKTSSFSDNESKKEPEKDPQSPSEIVKMQQEIERLQKQVDWLLARETRAGQPFCALAALLAFMLACVALARK